MPGKPWVPKYLSQLLDNAQDIGDEIVAAEAKTELVDADGIGVSNSEDGDILVEWTYASLKAQLSTFFGNLFQPLSSALSKITESGGLPFWDGGPWPSGGGGGKWSPLITKALSGNIAELFDPVDNVVTLDFTDVLLSVSGILQVGLSIDGGITYPATHAFEVSVKRSGLASLAANVGASKTALDLTNNVNCKLLNGKLVLSGLTTIGQVSVSGINIESPVFSQSYHFNGGGRFFTDGVVNKIKVTTSTGVQLLTGDITMSKRNW